MSDINPSTSTPKMPASAGTEPEFAPQDLQDFVRLLGQVLGAASLYGISHKIPQQALSDSFARLHGFFQVHETLSFATVDGNLLLEGCCIDTRNAQAAVFFKRLQVQNIDSFDLVKTITREELSKLLEILNMAPERLKAEGTLGDSLAKRGITAVRTNTASFQKVSQSDMVLKKDDLMSELATVAASVAGTQEKPKTIEQIVAFLKGDIGGEGTGGAGGKGGAKEGSSPENDADKLADLILKSAEIRPETAQVEGGESLVDLVVGSLRRHAQKLMESSAAHTQQGRKNIAKTLMLLEKTVLDKLRSMAGEAEINTDPIVEVFEDMKNDLQVDALATEYMKKRSQVEQVEGKILKYLRRHAGREDAAAGLQERLQEEGLTPEGWQQLQVRSGAVTPRADGGGGGEGGSGVGPGGGIGLDNVQMLAMLLTQLDSLLDPAKAQPGEEQVAEVVKKIDENLAAATEQTEKQLAELTGMVGSMAMAAETAEQQRQQELSRKRLLEIFAEITQELCQPLSVINCALDMMASKRLGEITDMQQEMLTLSTKNGHRLQRLVERLREICGNPESVFPDQAILDIVYAEPK